MSVDLLRNKRPREMGIEKQNNENNFRIDLNRISNGRSWNSNFSALQRNICRFFVLSSHCVTQIENSFCFLFWGFSSDSFLFLGRSPNIKFSFIIKIYKIYKCVLIASRNVSRQSTISNAIPTWFCWFFFPLPAAYCSLWHLCEVRYFSCRIRNIIKVFHIIIFRRNS